MESESHIIKFDHSKEDSVEILNKIVNGIALLWLGLVVVCAVAFLGRICQ